MLTINVNGKDREVDAAADTPLLWVIRDELKLMGTKFGCGMGLCGACTVHLDGNAVRSCTLPISSLAGAKITTIEGLSSAAVLHPVQQAWLEADVPQCGYCQSGQIMSASALINKNSNPSDAEIDAAMSGNLCRCGTYPRIRRAIHRAGDIAAAPAAGTQNKSFPEITNFFKAAGSFSSGNLSAENFLATEEHQS